MHTAVPRIPQAPARRAAFANCEELSKCTAVSLDAGPRVSRLGKGGDCDIPGKADFPGVLAWLRGASHMGLPSCARDRAVGIEVCLTAFAGAFIHQQSPISISLAPT